MFKQFTENIKGNQIYLIGSLAIFLIFFIVVTVMLVLLKKKDMDYMKSIPFENDPIYPNPSDLIL